MSDDRSALEAALGHTFANTALLDLALQHPSYAHEETGTRGNERLEFLGDAVLDLVVADLLYHAHPTWEEGALTRMRSSLVNTKALAKHARALALPDYLLLGRTERRSGGEQKDSILACLFEAVIGALYLDGADEAVRALSRKMFRDALERDAPPAAADPKTRFQEWTHAQLKTTPSYNTVADSREENAEDRFEVEVFVGERCYGRGHGRNKRAAERAAAKAALAEHVDGAGT